jgi:HK97 family phage portal protein
MAVNKISDLIATLPWHSYRDRNGTATKDDTPAGLLSRPDDPEIASAIGWRRQTVVSLLLRGNAFGLVLARDQRAWPTTIRITHPDDWSARRKGKLDRVEWRYDGQRVFPDEMWRVTAYETPGSPVGMSPIGYMAQAIGLGLAAQKYGSDWFEGEAIPSALLINDQAINEEQAKTAKSRWDEAANKREVRTLGGGWQYEQISVPAEESQFLETINANGAMIASIFGLAPEELGFSSGDSMTYTNVEHNQIRLLAYPIHAWVSRLEAALNATLPPPTYVKANVDALIRVDTRTRYATHDSAIRAGWKNRNEVRELEDMPPIAEDGDEYLWPPYRAFPIASDSDEGASRANPA